LRAMAAENVIVSLQRGAHTSSDRLLAGTEMRWTMNLVLIQKLGDGFLGRPDARHGPKQGGQQGRADDGPRSSDVDGMALQHDWFSSRFESLVGSAENLFRSRARKLFTSLLRLRPKFRSDHQGMGPKEGKEAHDPKHPNPNQTPSSFLLTPPTYCHH